MDVISDMVFGGYGWCSCASQQAAAEVVRHNSGVREREGAGRRGVGLISGSEDTRVEEASGGAQETTRELSRSGSSGTRAPNGVQGPEAAEQAGEHEGTGKA